MAQARAEEGHGAGRGGRAATHLPMRKRLETEKTAKARMVSKRIGMPKEEKRRAGRRRR